MQIKWYSTISFNNYKLKITHYLEDTKFCLCRERVTIFLLFRLLNFIQYTNNSPSGEIGKSMLVLQQKYFKLQTFENRSQNIFSQNLKKQIQRNINANSTEYFFSFSSFKILHLLIKSFVIPIPNRVFGALKYHFLKCDLKNLKNLNSSKNLKIDRLETKLTIIHTRKLKCISLIRIVHTDIILFIELGFPCPLVQNIVNVKINESSKSMIYEICSNVLSKWMDKIFHIQTILNQWIKRKVKDTTFIPHFIVGANSCNLKKVALNPV